TLESLRAIKPDSVKTAILFVFISRAQIAAALQIACEVLPVGFSANLTGRFNLVVSTVSAVLMIFCIVATACTGYFPAAVSAESITASVPSQTAFATSDASARVGRGLSIIH